MSLDKAVQGRQLLGMDGYRKDGRRIDEVRRPEITFGVVKEASGSCRYSVGGTTVVAHVNGPKPVEFKAEERADSATVKCEVFMGNVATEWRMISSADRYLQQTLTGQTQRIPDHELSQALTAAMIQVILLQSYPQSVIEVTVDIHKLDGAGRSASINAASLAVSHARIAMRDLAVSGDAGLVEGNIMADLVHEEVRHANALIHGVVLAHNPSRLLCLDTDSRIDEGMLTKLCEVVESSTAAFSAHFIHLLKVHLAGC